MKITTTKPVSISVGNVEPIDPGFVEKVCQYLDRIHDRITSDPHPYHVRLLAARPPLISNTQIQVIRSAFATTHGDHPVLPRWIQDSVILWDRELIHSEEISRRPLTHKEGNTSPLGSSRDRRDAVTHQFTYRKLPVHTKSP